MSTDRVVAPDPSAATDAQPAAHIPLPTGLWHLVPAASSATFSVLNWGLVTVRGSVPVVRGHVQLNTAGTVDLVHAELALDRLDTQNARRDRDLAKPSLLDLARYPALTFDGGSVATGASGLSLSGTVFAHGATVPVTLSVEMDPPVDGQVLVRATTELDRRDLGIRAPRVMIGHRIRVELSARFALGT